MSLPRSAPGRGRHWLGGANRQTSEHGICKESPMHHEPLASLETMLAPEMLTRVSREPIDSVRCAPFTGGHSASGSSFVSVETNDGRGPRFIVKLSSPASDWIVRATADELGREVLVWTSGLLGRLPTEIVHPVITCACDEGGWGILMRDVSDALIPNPMGNSPISRADHRRYLDALAALHVAFWDERAVIEPGLVSATRRTCIRLSPRKLDSAKSTTPTKL